MTKTNKDGEEKKQFYPDGTLKELMFIKDGKIEGEYTSYFQNGRIIAHLRFADG
ncbi:MAG: hypothetical protein HGB33_08920, partial [Syntrophaceae bacterium]|nr:hypothetical protein [Syntrophaceae bacterium]